MKNGFIGSLLPFFSLSFSSSLGWGYLWQVGEGAIWKEGAPSKSQDGSCSCVCFSLENLSCRLPFKAKARSGPTRQSVPPKPDAGPSHLGRAPWERGLPAPTPRALPGRTRAWGHAQRRRHDPPPHRARTRASGKARRGAGLGLPALAGKGFFPKVAILLIRLGAPAHSAPVCAKPWDPIAILPSPKPCNFTPESSLSDGQEWLPILQRKNPKFREDPTFTLCSRPISHPFDARK
jgi:hypothetical protein